MAKFEIVDLTEQPSNPTRGETTTARGSAQSLSVGVADTTELAAGLEALRQDLTDHIKSSDEGLKLTELRIKLTLGAEGKIAFVAKGTAEACVEVVFSAQQ